MTVTYPIALLSRIDKYGFELLFKPNASTTWQSFIKSVSKCGDGPMYIAAAVIISIYQHAHANLAILALLIGFAIERPVYFVLKNAFKRVRPCHCLVEGFIEPCDRFSLPSGHSSGAWLFCVVLVNTLMLHPLIYIFAVSVSLSRIMLGVHYPLDTVLGALLGSSCALLALSWIM
jgi:undecaprenyl-diphosphatase